MAAFDDIQKFIGRDWDFAAKLKRQFWRGKSSAERLDAGFQLYLHAREVNPEWPSAEDRVRDLEHHKEMARLFARIDEHSSKDA